ncbi:MAG: tetratricopeptide repeat protein [Phycisphaerales bacterium]|nr:tetratricopeptide repeat protein [Phycisphaerales bacterium]
MRSPILTGTLLSLTSLMLLGGCSGQGNYTREGVGLAKQRMSFLKSATEWEMGRQAFLAGDLEKALEKVDNSIEINNTVAKSHLLRGRILFELGELGSALKSLHSAEGYDPESPDTQYYLGITFERLNRPEDAYTHFAAACEFDDYNPVYGVAASEMLIDLDRIADAKAYLNGLPMSSDNAGIRQTLGHIAMINRDPDSAVGYFRDARLLAPDDTGIVEDLIHAQMLSGDFTKAERNITSLLKNKDFIDRTDLKLLHAKALMKTGRPVDARTIYQKMLSMDESKSDVQAWTGLANASYMIEDDRTMRKAASRVVSLAPMSPEGYTLWALAHRMGGDNIKALNSINNAIQRSRTDASMFAFRAVILRDLDRTGDAIASAAKAASLDPMNRGYQNLLDQFKAGRFAAVETVTE